MHNKGTLKKMITTKKCKQKKSQPVISLVYNSKLKKKYDKFKQKKFIKIKAERSKKKN